MTDLQSITAAAIHDWVKSLSTKKNMIVSDALLAPMIKACDPKTPGWSGRKTTIARLMRKQSGRPVTRDMVRSWLHHEPKKRRQPSLAYGLLLISVFTQLEQTPPTQKNDKPIRSKTGKGNQRVRKTRTAKARPNELAAR